MTRAAHAFYKEVISGRRKTITAKALRGALLLLSYLYSAGISIRSYAYARGFLKRYRPKAFVISIGNIVAGGTGKTPFTIYVAQYFAQKLPSVPIAILLRGYKSQAEKGSAAIKVTAGHRADEVGDEARLLKKRAPQACVYAGRDRVLAAGRAQDDGARICLLDDGMQHLKLERDVNICLIDASNPFGYGYLLPRGLLREPVSSLKRADLIVITNATRSTETLEIDLHTYTKAPIAKAIASVDGVYDLQDQRIDLPRGVKVALFSGIGNPQAFYDTVASMGLVIVAESELRDHEAMTLDALHEFVAMAMERGASYILCTEKDAVKIPSGACGPIAYVRMSMQIISGEEHLTTLLKIG